MKTLLPGSLGQCLLEASHCPGRKREQLVERPMWKGAQACSPRDVLLRSYRQLMHAACKALHVLCTLLFSFSISWISRTQPASGPWPVFFSLLGTFSSVPTDWLRLILRTRKRHLRENVSDHLVKETPARCPYSPTNDRWFYFFRTTYDHLK